MRLKKAQKEAVLKWIAAGLQTDEINERAASFAPSFSVSRGQVQWYRRSRDVQIEALKQSGEFDALKEGLADSNERVDVLQKLARLMMADLFGGFLWLEDVKGVGAGDAAEVVDYEKFNAAEVAQLRGVLDDIAKETGGRVQRQDITSAGEKVTTDETGYNRAVSTLADAIGKALSGKDNEPASDMDAAE